MTNSLMVNGFDQEVISNLYADKGESMTNGVSKMDEYDQIAALKAELAALKEEKSRNEKIAALRAELAELKGGSMEEVTKVDSNLKKNQKPGKASSSRKYVVFGPMKNLGKVPQQQADLAAILSSNMEVGKEYTEQEVFNFLIDGSGDYPSLSKSTQDVTYLFRYYRGLKNDGKHAGFIARDFLRMI